MSRCTLSKNFNLEVAFLNFALIILFVLLSRILPLALKVGICSLEGGLLSLKTALNDLSTGQETLLKVTKSLILNHNSGLFIEVLRAEAQLLEDGCEVILLLLVLSLLLIRLLALLHLVSCLVIDGLFEDLREESLSVVVLPELLDVLFEFKLPVGLGKGSLLLLLDLLVASALHLEDALVSLSLLALLGVFLIHVATNLGVSTDELITNVVLLASSDVARIVVLVNVYFALRKIELSPADLFFGLNARIESEFLSHLQDNCLAFVLSAAGDKVIIVDGEILLLPLVEIRIESDASVNKLVLTALVSLEGLAANLLLTIDKAILVTMVIEVYLPDTAINLNNLLPVVR